MRKDRRLTAIALTAGAVLLIGGIVTLLPQREPTRVMESTAATAVENPAVDPRLDPTGHEHQAREEEVSVRFQQAVAMLHAKQYEYAIKALHRVLELAPRLPEAYVNMGFALIGTKNYKAAIDFFDTAIRLKPMQTNAFYGLALSYEGQKDYMLAVSAMESFIHLAPADDPYLEKARAASWEWNELLKIERSGKPAPTITGRDIETKERVSKTFGE